MSMPYELQKFSDSCGEHLRPSDKRNEFLDFEEQVRHFHEEFNLALTKFLEEVATQEEDHYSDNVLHVLYR